MSELSEIQVMGVIGVVLFLCISWFSVCAEFGGSSSRHPSLWLILGLSVFLVPAICAIIFG